MSDRQPIGILTGGGDCPGLNAAIRAVVRRALLDDVPVLGIKNGWRGLIEENVELLTRNSVLGILQRGGTILGTSRLNPCQDDETAAKIKETCQKLGLHAVIVVGGEGTLGGAYDLFRDYGLPVVGVPKTIDNDICGTDFTFGFQTAVAMVTDAVDRLLTTAESHHRVMIVEVMGRHTGWIAAYGGLAGGADLILVPEKPFKISEICQMIENRRTMGRTYSVLVVAEDSCPDPSEDFLTEDEKREIYRHDRLGGIGLLLGRELERKNGIETRVTTLGYMQRGGSPSAFDRVLATRVGVYAVEMCLRNEFGHMAAITGNKIVSVPLSEVIGKLKTLPDDLYRTAEVLFG